MLIVRPSTPPDGPLPNAVANAFDIVSGATEPSFPALLEWEGSAGRRYRLFANALMRLTTDARYLEVGAGAGATFCAALAGNSVRAVAIDDWSQPGTTRERLLRNLACFPLGAAEFRLIERDFRDIDFAGQGRFNVYLFDGPPSTANQRDGLTMALPALDSEFVFIVGGWNQAGLREGIRRTIKQLGLSIAYAIEIETPADDTDWHGGMFIAVLTKPVAAPSLAARALASFASGYKRLAAARDSPEQAVSKPAASEVLVLITHHYAADRLHWLSEVLQGLTTLGARRTHVLIVTNTSDASALATIRNTASPYLAADFSAEVETAPPLLHPHDLPWAQKPFIRDRFLGRGSPFTHVVSLEDDMALGREGFQYWLQYRPLLAAHGLIPSFMRTEMRLGDPVIYATDATTANSLGRRPSVAAGGFTFVALDNPYCALFILDRALAREYVASDAFHMGASMAISPWWTRERAAMGLCWSNPPPGFAVRHVVPVDAATHSVAACAHVRHLPGNYANDPSVPYGKLPADAVLRP